MSQSPTRSPLVALSVGLLIGLKAMTCLGASFDCANAASSIEKWICSDKELSYLDYRLAKDYQLLLASAPDKVRFRDEQRRWLLNVRDACRDSGCLLRVYSDRVGVLSAAVAARPSPEVKCEFNWDKVPLSIPEKVKTYFRSDIPDDSNWIDIGKYAYHNAYSLTQNPDGSRISYNVKIRSYRDGSLTVETLRIYYPPNTANNQHLIKYEKSDELPLGRCRPK